MAKKHNNKKSKRIRDLVAICSLCAILLSVSTYAWFIGMKTVNVAEFSVNIATTEGLFLSMDGKTWEYTLDARNADPYTGNANQWLENSGLIPMSSVGDMDKASSRMKLFEKGSLTAVTGGYRLLSKQVDNHTTLNAGGVEYEEGNGYVAFDLFIKNLSGNPYYPENNVLNEEAIYLTTNSEVKVSQNGGVEKAGIENSVRVAFAQIGRVKADTTSADNITKITCADVPAAAGQVQVTGICRDAQIWEPNDTKHVQNAINWYQKSCLTRKASTDGDDVNDPNSYNTGSKCTAVKDGTAYPTYAISNNIEIADNVNIYDGAAYNTYTANTNTLQEYNDAEEGTDPGQKGAMKLIEFPYFTDTMKNVAGKDRPQFMTLAPNSITKVRVYIWIEGQDIDNYDFASLGKKITVNFGFTKERYNESDIPGYDGPSTDITPTNGE